MDYALQDNEEDMGIAEPEHLETMFDALDDTFTNVDGTEGLTRAQHYAQAVLVGAGMVRPQVAGNEGFFQTLGEGAKKIWEYIQKMFKSMWAFFFGKGSDTSKAKVEKAEATVAENQKVMGDEFDENKSDTIEVRQARMKSRYTRFITTVESRFDNWKPDKDEQSPHTSFMQRIRVEYEASIRDTKPVVDALADMRITSASQAKEAQGKLATLLRCFGKDQEMFTRHKGDYEKLLSDLEQKINGTADEFDKMVMEFELDAAKLGMSLFAKFAQLITETTAAVTELSNLLKTATK